MRGQIIQALRERMKTDPSLFFITADMGINLVEVIEAEFPDRFLNVGIAEQNAVGVAAGLANLGYRPWVYSISHFLVHRCFEQLRNDVALHKYPITLLGTSAGYDNAPLGPTHHIIDDWGSVANLPGATVYAPTTVEFAAGIVDRVLRGDGLTYVRVAKGTPSVVGSGQDLFLRGRNDVGAPLIVSYGGVGARLVADDELLQVATVAIANRLSPLPEALTDIIAAEPQDVLVVEDHFPRNGLAGSVAGFIAENGLKTRLHSFAPREFDIVVAPSPTEYERRNGIDPTAVRQWVAQQG